MPDVEPYLPTQYSWYWLAIAIALTVLIVAIYLLLPAIARRMRDRPPRAPRPAPAPPTTPLQSARAIALERVRTVEAAVGAGVMDVRDAHLELSVILREFATQVTGIDARPMTLTELRASKLDAIAAVVATYYPIAFGISERSTLDGAADRATAVVAAWR